MSDRHYPDCLDLIVCQGLVCYPHFLLGFSSHYVAGSLHAGDFLVCSPQFLPSHTFHSFVVCLSCHIFSDLIGMQYSVQNDQGPVNCPHCFHCGVLFETVHYIFDLCPDHFKGCSAEFKDKISSCLHYSF